MPKSPLNGTPDELSSPYSPARPPADPSTSETPATVPPVEPPTAAEPPALPPPPTGPAIPAPYALAAPTPYLSGPQKLPATLSLLAMIFGIVGLVLSCCYGAGFLFGAAGVVLGHLGRKRETAQGMALAGLITGYTSVGLSLIMWVLLFALAMSPLLMLPFLAYS